MKPKVSVVIPLYNAEKYIKACIDSILAQTLNDIEAVIVDDCSTDGSFALCRELYGDDSRVVLLQQPQNSGPGNARNSGIKHAHGKYIAFADSDDQMKPDHISEMFEAAEKYNADVLHSTGFIICKGDNSRANMLTLPANDFMKVSLDMPRFKELAVMTASDRDTMLNAWAENVYSCHVFSKLFRRDLLLNNDIAFTDSPMAEDVLFCFAAMFHSERYVILPHHGYIYRTLNESLSRSKSPADVLAKSLISAVKVMRAVQNVMKNIPFFAENKDRYGKVLDALASRLDKFHIIPCYKQLTEDALRNNEKFSGIFDNLFGLDSPYVQHLFYSAYNSQPDIPDLWSGAGSSNSDFWEIMKDD